MNVLDRIVATTRETLERERPDLRRFRAEAEGLRSDRKRHAFASTLAGGRNAERARLITEIKAASPSAGDIVANPDVEAIAETYLRGGASAISIVTEPYAFKGSRAWLARATRATKLPVIMKDFVIEPVQLYQGAAAGADAILLLASLLDAPQLRDFIALLNELGVDALVETHDEDEVIRALKAEARIIGVNNRDLRDFKVSLATSERLIQEIPPEAIRVSESGISTRGDVDRLLAAGFDAFLVGESLLRQSDRESAVKRLVERSER
jgi:indole-3-glycerol phosphate synthase